MNIIRNNRKVVNQTSSKFAIKNVYNKPVELYGRLSDGIFFPLNSVCIGLSRTHYCGSNGSILPLSSSPSTWKMVKNNRNSDLIVVFCSNDPSLTLGGVNLWLMLFVWFEKNGSKHKKHKWVVNILKHLSKFIQLFILSSWTKCSVKMFLNGTNPASYCTILLFSHHNSNWNMY